VSKLSVLLLNYEFPPAGGGAGNATFQIARQLVPMGVNAEVLTARIEGEEDGAFVDGVKVWRVPSWRKGVHDCGLVGAYSWVAFAAWKRRKLLRERPYDLEHYFFGLPTGILSQLFFPRTRPPYIVSLRGSDVPGYDPFNRKLESLHRVLRPLTRRIWRKSRAVVALSDALRDMAKVTARDQEIDVIGNGIDIDRFHPPSSPPAEGGPLRVVCVSRLLERKGIHHLLEAIARPEPLPLSLKVIGTGTYEQKLMDRCDELGLRDRVEFVGFVPRDQLPDHYRAAQLFALPSMTESFGLVFAEAMACGLPVLATTIGGIPSIVRSGEDGILVEARDVDALRRELTRFIAEPERRSQMGLNARKRVVDRFTWRSVAERYLRCYNAALGYPELDRTPAECAG